MKTTATDLCAPLYENLDKVALTGEGLELERKGIRIIRDFSISRINELVKRPTMLVASQIIVDQNWTDSWKSDL